MKASRVLISSVALFLIILAGATYGWIDAHRAQLELGVGYAARVGCGCRYIDGRPLADCHKDFEPGMEPIRLSEDATSKVIVASVPLIASRRVRYDPILGCQAEPFKGRELHFDH